tara:strand:+ start:1318 stop:1749 length:432 start_codon:yes stop_codon:yes gene_type:complete
MKVLQTVNLGKSQGGSSGSIRYAVYDTLGVEKISSTNTGIYEIGTSTGIYGAELNLSTQFSGSILWSVDGNSSIYATEEIKIDQKMARYIHTGRWLIDESTQQMTFFQDDNETEIARFDLFDRNGNKSITELFERRLVGTGSV